MRSEVCSILFFFHMEIFLINYNLKVVWQPVFLYMNSLFSLPHLIQAKKNLLSALNTFNIEGVLSLVLDDILNINNIYFDNMVKVSNGAKIRNRYNQVPHLTQDTNGKVTNSQKTPQTRAKRSALSQQVTTKHI